MWIYIHCNFSYTRPYQRMMRATGWKGDSFAASIKGEYPVSFYSHYTNRHTHTYIYNIFKCRMHVEFLIVQLFHSDRHINRGAGCPRWVVHVHNYFNGKPFWKLDIERHVARLVVACTWFDLHDGPSCVAFNRIGDYIYICMRIKTICECSLHPQTTSVAYQPVKSSELQKEEKLKQQVIKDVEIYYDRDSSCCSSIRTWLVWHQVRIAIWKLKNISNTIIIL